MNNFLFYIVGMFWFASLVDFIFAKMGYGINEYHFVFRKFYIDQKKAKNREVQMLFSRSLMWLMLGFLLLVIWAFHFYIDSSRVVQSSVDFSQYNFDQLNLMN